jgi:ubiquinol-cytochrome c reductase cytochrome b subunit
LVTPPHIVPEWYFLPFYAILRSIPDKLGGVLAIFGAILVLYTIPYTQSSEIQSSSFRPIYRLLFWLFVADFFNLIMNWSTNCWRTLYFSWSNWNCFLFYIFFNYYSWVR